MQTNEKTSLKSLRVSLKYSWKTNVWRWTLTENVTEQLVTEWFLDVIVKWNDSSIWSRRVFHRHTRASGSRGRRGEWACPRDFWPIKQTLGFPPPSWIYSRKELHVPSYKPIGNQNRGERNQWRHNVIHEWWKIMFVFFCFFFIKMWIKTQVYSWK